MPDQTSSPAGDDPVEPRTSAAPATDAAGEAAGDEAGLDDRIADAEAAIDEARRRVAEAPAEVVVVNHVMGLYELGAIHLSATPPDLRAAALAIDAVACLVEGLGDRLGEEATTLRDALNNIRLAFVQMKGRAAASPSESAAG